jgi:hypothetical protein
MPDVNSDDPLAGNWLYYQPISAQSILQQVHNSHFIMWSKLFSTGDFRPNSIPEHFGVNFHQFAIVTIIWPLPFEHSGPLNSIENAKNERRKHLGRVNSSSNPYKWMLGIEGIRFFSSSKAVRNFQSETQILRMELDRRREEEDSGIGGRP